MSGIRTAYRTLFVITVSAGLLFFALETFGAFELNRVTLDGADIPLESSKALGFAPGSSVFRQPLALTANMMCRRVGVGAARVAIVSTNAIDIRTNEFEAAYLVYDSQSKRLRGLTAGLVVAPLDTKQDFASTPLFTGLSGVALFERPSDFRLEIIGADLQRLRDKNEELFLNVSAIDCSHEHYLTVSFRNTDVALKTMALAIGKNIVRMQAIISGAADITQEPKVVDMRFDGLMIIPQETDSNTRQASKKRHG